MSLVSVKHHDGGVAVVTFDKAETMNSLDPATMREVREAILRLLADAKVRALVLTGSGEKFHLDADHPGVIEPRVTHRVRPLGRVRFYIEFYR